MKSLLSFAMLGLTGLSLIGCNGETEAQRVEDQMKWERLNKAFEETKKELQEKHHATVFPPNEYADHPVFTYTLQQTLVDGKDHPVLFKGLVEDVTSDKGEFFIHATGFFSKHPRHDGRRLLVHIRASRAEIEPLLAWSETKKSAPCACALQGPLAYFVVKIRSVDKVTDASKRESLGYAAEDTAIFEAVADLVALQRLPEN